jgi:rare lipoprotein A
MIITTRNVYSTVGLLIGMLVATALFFALPSLAQDQQGKASWSAMNQHGRKTASGEHYDHRSLTAAHATLPFDSMVRVRNVVTGQQVMVRVNDRTQDAGTVIGLSGAAAQQLGLFDQGAGAVELWYIDMDQSVIIASSDRAAGESERRSVPMNRGATMPADVATVPQPSSAPIEEAGSLTMTSWFTLQLGSFATLESAETLAHSYEEAWIRSVETADGAVFRVYFSRFDTEGPARSAQNRLRAEGQESFLRRVGP